MDATYVFHIRNKDIDRKKWDACIDASVNRNIYAYAGYLDHMSGGWDALVLGATGNNPASLGTYKAVMPLTWRKKYGFSYLFQPFLTAQLGVFSDTLSPAMVESFLNAIPRQFKYWDICLNHGNLFDKLEGYACKVRKNYVLDLSKPYHELSSVYRENTRRNIKKAKEAVCRVSKDFEVEQVIGLALGQMKSFDKDAARNVELFRSLYQSLHEKKQAITYGIFTGGEELLASAVFFIYQNRAYYILVGNHPLGKNVGASHALVDAFIKDHAGQSMLLDFEGSDIPSLAAFYASFGAKEENYPAIKLNRLPFYAKWLKK